MLPRRYSHYMFAVIQSGLTALIASGIANAAGGFDFVGWMQSWLLAWTVMIPVVILAAPVIRGLVHRLTKDD